MFHKMPFILLFVIGLGVLCQPFISENVQAQIYALSLLLKSLILFVLPYVIFGLLFKTAMQLSKQATKMVFWILLFICCSNFISTMLSYNMGKLVCHFDLSIALPSEQLSLEPAWVVTFPKWISNSIAMFAGLTLGAAFSFIRGSWAEKFSLYLEKSVHKILLCIFGCMPLFVLGFILKLTHDGSLVNIVKDYALIFAIIALSVFTYIACIYWVSSHFNFNKLCSSIKNMLPAGLAGFSSMSSAVAMPLTIVGAEKNTQSSDIAKAVIPVTVNVHLIGDCFAIPIFAFAILKSFGLAEPAFFTYLLFALYFVIAKFSVAAIPGGGIIVMLPILEGYLGFDAEMMSLITALYILFDPVITCANILGNGGFAMAFSQFFKRIKKQKLIRTSKNAN